MLNGAKGRKGAMVKYKRHMADGCKRKKHACPISSIVVDEYVRTAPGGGITEQYSAVGRYPYVSQPLVIDMVTVVPTVGKRKLP